MIKRSVIAASLATFAFLPITAYADEVLQNLNDAIAAYAAGDVGEAREILEYTKIILDQKQSNAFSDVLPSAMDGWTREDGDGSMSQALGMMGGGGLAAEASYSKESGENIDIAIIGDSPMIAMMAAQLGNPALMAQMGEVKRINRQKVLLNNDGGLQALVENRFLVQMEGSASQDEMVSYFEKINFDVLKNF